MPPLGAVPNAAPGVTFAWVIIPWFSPVHPLKWCDFGGPDLSPWVCRWTMIRAGQSKPCIPLTIEIGSEKNMWPKAAPWNAIPGLPLELSEKRHFLLRLLNLWNVSLELRGHHLEMPAWESSLPRGMQCKAGTEGAQSWRHCSSHWVLSAWSRLELVAWSWFQLGFFHFY